MMRGRSWKHDLREGDILGQINYSECRVSNRNPISSLRHTHTATAIQDSLWPFPSLAFCFPALNAMLNNKVSENLESILNSNDSRDNNLIIYYISNVEIF
jgi:hypothetical protein